MRKHGNLIKRTFKDNLGNFIHSVQPLITKCVPGKTDDPDYLRQLINNQLLKELENEKVKMEKEYNDNLMHAEMEKETQSFVERIPGRLF